MIQIAEISKTEQCKLIRQHLENHCSVKLPRLKHHQIIRSNIENQGRMEFWYFKIKGAGERKINAFLKDRKLLQCCCSPDHSMIAFTEVHYETWTDDIHIIDLNSKGGMISSFRTDMQFEAFRPQYREVLLKSRKDKTWVLRNIDSGKERQVADCGHRAYVSADGRYMFVVEDWRAVTLFDLETGRKVDEKTKRHLSKYATKVIILYVVRFDPDTPALYLHLMRQQSLAFDKMIMDPVVRMKV